MRSFLCRRAEAVPHHATSWPDEVKVTVEPSPPRDRTRRERLAEEDAFFHTMVELVRAIDEGRA